MGELGIKLGSRRLVHTLTVLLILSLATCTAYAQQDQETNMTIRDRIGENQNFLIMAGALNNSSVNDILSGQGQSTLFLPTDEAFGNLSEGTLEALLQDPDAMESVLLNHVANGTLRSEDLANMSNVTTLRGNNLSINNTDLGLFVGDARVLQANVTANNGIIHVIDTVLIPPELLTEQEDIIDTAASEGNFTTLLLALDAANLTDTLRGEGPFTVFAPTDEAFDALPNGTLEGLLNNTTALQEILLYHVAEGRVTGPDVLNLTNITTLQGSQLPINVTNQGVFVGNAQIIVNDINTSNGVIHSINAVLIPPAGNQTDGNQTDGNQTGNVQATIIELARNETNLTTFVTAVEAANLAEPLNETGPFTVFAPTNEAFNALPAGALESLLNNTSALREILLYHVASENLSAQDVINVTNITTVQGSELPVSVTDQGVFVGNAQIIVQDINASNGIIHIIDAVLIPPAEPEEQKGIIDTAADNGNFTTLLTALNATNLTDTLRGEGPFTVFAPTDEAFAALPNGTIESLLNNTTALSDILRYHVAGERLMGSDVLNLTNITTLQGDDLPVTVTNQGIFVGTAQIIVSDINATNGVIHSINAVLIPPAGNQTGNQTDGNQTDGNQTDGNQTGGNQTDGNQTGAPQLTIIGAAQNETNLSTFVSAVEAANLTEALNGTGPFTVFAPDNEAFGKLSPEVLGQLANNTTLLRQVLLYHVVNGNLTQQQLAGMDNVTNVLGNVLPINTSGNNITVGNATITQAIAASNGALYVIDNVLVPPGIIAGNQTGNQTDGNQTGGNQTDGNQTEQNLTELYNDTVTLTQGNFTVSPENTTQTYQANNLTDIGALNATGLRYAVSLQNMTGNMTANMNNLPFVLQSIEGIRNNNTTGQSWFTYINGTEANRDFGLNNVSNGTNLSFWYTTEQNGRAEIDNATYVANVTVNVTAPAGNQTGNQTGGNQTGGNQTDGNQTGVSQLTIIGAAQNETNLSTFVSAVEAANLTEAL
ncbi:MAG: fasciclin domain-containing protein, partial [Methanosarcina sp.]